MKKLLTLWAVLLATVSLATAQSPASCCAKPEKATEVFAMLGANEEFVRGHEDPMPYQYEGPGEMIEFSTADGKPARGFEIKSNVRSDKYVFVIHEWWGLNDYIKKESFRYANELKGVNVIALDLYDGQVATTAEEAARLMQGVTTERAEAIIKGALLHVGNNAQIATLGWCFGGSWSLQTALLAGPKAVGCIMYYGMPEKDPARLKTLNTDVLGIFAQQDRSITPAVVAQFTKDMAAAKKKLTVKFYDADHAFANPSNPRYNRQFAEDAHALSLAYLRKALKLKG
ncbi:dienelactone hydrolase family protein [Hymenobacter sp. J193]|uniref:dienelactone hydrolase family protein n=1 Tax=Hymenobacter sp. J193 TaxID=2898429 RepID=UPI002150BB2A|nr:dienelactone hydrolase family protein [Hymenobacter sp. J193]MCR5889576.1 dienelactone hydrolase family protein [Hymenobacter sp. J193]